MHNAPVIFALITEFGSIGLPRVTIGTVPDDDILEILFSMLVRPNGRNTGIHYVHCTCVLKMATGRLCMPSPSAAATSLH